MATAQATQKVLRYQTQLPQMEKAREAPRLKTEYILLIAGVVVGAVFFAVGVLNAVNVLTIQLGGGAYDAALAAADFAIFGAIVMIAPYAFYMVRKLNRISAIESRLPDFLRDVAEAGRFGMTLPDAIVVASKGRYGLLTEEIKKMASQLEWGVPVATALQLFEERVPTPLVTRVVSIITRANQAGGNVADVLTMVARDTRNAQLQERARQDVMLTYVTVIYIAFVVFLITIFILAAVFLPKMVEAGQGIASSNLGGGPVTVAFNLVPELFLIFLVAVMVHALGDGILAGVLQRGKLAFGLQHAVIMLVMGWVFMRVIVPLASG